MAIECGICGTTGKCATCVRERTAERIKDAVRAEREACAALVDEAARKVRGSSSWWGALLAALSSRIRART